MQDPFSEGLRNDSNHLSLIERAQAGDLEAFQVLILEYRPLLYKVISDQQVTERSRDDRTQDIHLKLLEVLRAGKIPPMEDIERLLGYLKIIFRNVCMDEVRKKKTKRNGGDRKREDFASLTAVCDPGQASPSRLAMGRELLEGLRIRLTEGELQVLDLMIDATTFEATGTTPKEIARQLGITLNAVYQRIHHIHQKCNII